MPDLCSTTPVEPAALIRNWMEAFGDGLGRSLGTSCGRRFVFLSDFDGRSWDSEMDAGNLLGKANRDGFGFRGVGRAG